MLCMIYLESKRGAQGTTPVSWQTAILISGSSEIVFQQFVVLKKCWLDFQLLNTGIRTEVIVVFYPLSSSCI